MIFPSRHDAALPEINIEPLKNDFFCHFPLHQKKAILRKLLYARTAAFFLNGGVNDFHKPSATSLFLLPAICPHIARPLALWMC
jgi:hypothetical protein